MVTPPEGPRETIRQTTLVEDPATGTRAIVNASSDNPSGRLVGSSLAVFTRAR
jgi:hypothetical protein